MESDNRYNLLCLFQVLFHCPEFFNEFLNREMTEMSAKTLRNKFVSISKIKNQHLKPWAFFNQVEDSLPELLGEIDLNGNYFDEILKKIHKTFSGPEKNCCKCPACEIFLLQGGYGTTAGIEVFGNFTYVLDSDFIKNWNSNMEKKIELSNPPVNLVVYCRTFEDNFQEIECRSNGKVIKYKLMRVVSKNIRHTYTCMYIGDTNLWYAIEGKHPIELKLLDNHPKYFFFQKKIDEKVLKLVDEFLKAFFFSLYLLKNFLSKLKDVKGPIGWLRTLKFFFKNFSRNNSNYSIDDFSLLSEKYIEISKIIKDENLFRSDLDNLNIKKTKNIVGPLTRIIKEMLGQMSCNKEADELIGSIWLIENGKELKSNAINLKNSPIQNTPDYLLVIPNDFSFNHKVQISIKFYYNGDNHTDYTFKSIIFVSAEKDKVKVLNFDINEYQIVDEANLPVNNLAYEFESASGELYNYQNCLLIYSKSNEITEKSGGTYPLRVGDNNNSLIFLNSTVQALYNIPSVRKDICNWDCEEKWASDLKDLFKIDGIKSFKSNETNSLCKLREHFSNYDNKKYVDEHQYCEFFSQILQRIHNSGCSRKCPACKNFNICGFVKKNNDPNQESIKKYFLDQSLEKDNIQLKGDVLNIIDGIEYHYDLPNPPYVLFIKLTIGANKNNITSYLKNNEFINYENFGNTYNYRLKSIILCKDNKYKALLYTETGEKWRFMSGVELKKVTPNLLEYDFNKYIPVGLLYYCDLPSYKTPEEIIKLTLPSLFEIFSHIPKFKEALSTKFADDTVHQELLKTVFRDFCADGNNGIISDISFLSGFKKSNTKELFESICQIIHDRPKQNCTCNCGICSLIFFELSANQNDSVEKVCSLGMLSKFGNIFKTYNVRTQSFTRIEELTSGYSSADLIKPPEIVVVDGADFMGNISWVKNTIAGDYDGKEYFYVLDCMLVKSDLKNKIFPAISNQNGWIVIDIQENNEFHLSFDEIFKSNYKPELLIYIRCPLNYIKVSIKALYLTESFRDSIAQLECRTPWSQKLLDLFEKIDKINVQSNLYDFKLTFNENYSSTIESTDTEEYDVKNTIGRILNRIYEECNDLHHSSYLPYELFLLKGNTFNRKTQEIIKLDSLSITHTLSTAYKSFISGNTLGNILQNGQNQKIDFYLENPPPPILYYNLEYSKSANDDIEKVRRMYEEFLRDHKLIKYDLNQQIFYYEIKTIVFKLINASDQYFIARNIEQHIWTINDNQKETTPELIISSTSSNKNSFWYPIIVLYERKK